MKALKETLQKDESALSEIMSKWRELMLMVPNIPDVSVPEGESDAQNVEVKKVGTIPTFSFTPKNHVDLMKAHNMVDFDAGTEVAGFRGYFLKNDGALLIFALQQFVIDFFKTRGFEFTIAPSVVRKEGLYGTGYLPQGEEDLYKTQDQTYLVGTAEVPTMASFMGKVFSQKDFPKKVLAFSPCFRREAGSHGKDTKGIFRVHEFYKFEQVILCEANHETSVALHEELTKNAEDILTALGIPYHVVVNCGGDLGLGQVKKYDIEAWVPSENTYRETHSSSYFHDFQTRRLNIKYKDAEGKSRFAHSLNNTALAMPRILVSLLENYQEADGTIRVPEALQTYLGKKIIGN
jgi:seryl-tRNA synthetase